MYVEPLEYLPVIQVKNSCLWLIFENWLWNLKIHAFYLFQVVFIENFWSASNEIHSKSTFIKA